MVFIHNWSPVLAKLGPLEIRWYGLMYVMAFIITLYYMRKATRAGRMRLSNEDIDTLLTWCVLGLIIGARMFAVVFWEPRYYSSHVLEVFAVWRGGLSFHGGVLGVIVAVWLFCRKKNYSFFEIGDIMIVPLALGQALGRFGNFMNSELFGPPTLLSWGINFLGEHDAVGNLVFRHPTMLYEAAYGVVIFGVLLFLSRKKHAPGVVVGVFFVLYSIFRSLTELIRVEEVFVGSLTMGQVLNIPLFVVGLYLVVRKQSKK